MDGLLPDNQREEFLRNRSILLRRMNLEVEMLQREALLSENQRARLQVAAKGVVEQLLEAAVIDPDDAFGSHFRAMDAQGEFLRTHPLWQTAMVDVLTDDQRGRVRVAVATHRKYRRDAAVEVASGLLQETLQLSLDQRRKVEILLHSSLPSDFYEPFLEVGIYTRLLDGEQVEQLLSDAQWARWTDLVRHMRHREPFEF
ncbi:MAG: hypothetical protein AAGJ31_04520 [Verrucomicrobiota bacterium]